jgi:DNA-binding YbaB/EbfC family protein
MSNNMLGMLKKAQDMQKGLKAAQDQLAKSEVTGTAGGGVVNVLMKGSHELVKVSIKPDAVDPKDVGMLEDLLVVACNDALAKANALAQEKMKAVTGGLGIPGLGL